MMLTDYMSYTLDATTYEMVIIAKLQMFAWGCYDGIYDRVKDNVMRVRSRRTWTRARRMEIA